MTVSIPATQAARAARVALSTLKRWLQDPSFQALIASSPLIRPGAPSPKPRTAPPRTAPAAARSRPGQSPSCSALILAVGSIQDRVVAMGGAVMVRPTLDVVLTADHRAIDGAEAALFLQTFALLIEEPALAL